jgi:hypothetical protein
MIATLLLLVTAARGEDARPIPRSAWTPESRLALARELVAEADFSLPDHAAIAWVLADRWQRVRGSESFGDYVQRYSSLAKPPHTARKREIRALPWGRSEAPHGREGWDRLGGWLEAWSRGSVPHPCPGARHWGGPRVDRFPSRAVTVVCGETKNRFFFVARHAPAAKPRSER